MRSHEDGANPRARQDDSPDIAEKARTPGECCATCAASLHDDIRPDAAVWCCHPDRCLNIFDGVIPRSEPADFRCDLWREVRRG